jgi:aminoglycoside phosphotransferase family enzyme/predicted kinase
MDSASIGQLFQSLPRGEYAEQTLLRETHISWVILCNEFAYKIKKPVNFDFLDFSTLEQRRHFCEEELRLNRRFSPELYLAVVPVTRGGSGPEIAGAGPVIDYAVKMHRFSEEQLLDVVAAREGLGPALLRALAEELARIHEDLPACRPDPASSAPGTPAALLQAIEQNFQQISGYTLPEEQQRELHAIQQWSRRRHRELLPVMVERLLEGKVIDGHGDAHLGNIALVDGAVRLFDCIEFNAAFRIMDAISEIAFLDMDMDARGYHGASHRLLTDYLEYSGDYAGLQLLGLFRCYFAMVRAKVNLLRELPGDVSVTATNGYREFLRYVELARACTRPNGVFLAITHGVSGSGKTTVAGALVEASGAVRLRSDVERKRLAGIAPEQRSAPQQQAELYSLAMSRRTFARLEELAAEVIGAGLPVIVDATFLHRGSRDNFRQLADTLSIPFVIVDCVADPAQLRQRLVERESHGRDASEATVAVMENQVRDAQPLAREEQPYRLAVESAEDTATLWGRFQAHMAISAPGGTPMY